MVSQDWSAEEQRADLVVEIQLPDQVPHGWTEPVLGIVLATHHGTTPARAQLSMRLVADPDAQFNGTLASFLADERWLVCAHQLDDGTVLPQEGTRRLHRESCCRPPSTVSDAAREALAIGQP